MADTPAPGDPKGDGQGRPSGPTGPPPAYFSVPFLGHRLLPFTIVVALLPVLFFAISGVNRLRGEARDSDAVLTWALTGLVFLPPGLLAALVAVLLVWRAHSARRRRRDHRDA